VKNVVENEEIIRKVRQTIETTKRTYRDFKKYGAEFWVDNLDCGTVNIIVVSPRGDICVTTSTINTLSVHSLTFNLYTSKRKIEDSPGEEYLK
jgi:hypothetical protein